MNINYIETSTSRAERETSNGLQGNYDEKYLGPTGLTNGRRPGTHWSSLTQWSPGPGACGFPGLRPAARAHPPYCPCCRHRGTQTGRQQLLGRSSGSVPATTSQLSSCNAAQGPAGAPARSVARRWPQPMPHFRLEGLAPLGYTGTAGRLANHEQKLGSGSMVTPGTAGADLTGLRHPFRQPQPARAGGLYHSAGCRPTARG